MQTRRRRMTALATAALLVATAGLASCGDDGNGSEGSGTSGTQVGPGASTTTGDGGDDSTTTGNAGPGPLRVEAEEAGTADEPTFLLPRPGDAGHVYVAERGGTIVRMEVADDGTLSKVGDPLLDISSDTTTESERGLLGLAFSKDGGTIYVSHTNADGDTRLDGYAMDGDGIEASSKETILEQDQPFPNHNGGNVVLGPDGKVWFGLGDGGAGDDPKNNAQNPDTILGKIMRLTPGEEPEIVVSGVRNPWRFSFDTDGSLWIADVGQNQWEEIDRLAADDIDGANLGWSGYEGTHEYLDGDGRRPDDAIPPIFEYSHDTDNNCSVTGGFVYRGKVIPALDGAYLFADYCAGNLRAITVDSKGQFAKELDLGIHVDSPISFGTDEDGEPYVLSQTGKILRLVDAS